MQYLFNWFSISMTFKELHEKETIKIKKYTLPVTPLFRNERFWLMKCSIKTLQNLTYFWNMKTHVVFSYFFFKLGTLFFDGTFHQA